MRAAECEHVNGPGTNSKLASVREIVHVFVMEPDLWAHPSEPRTNESMHWTMLRLCCDFSGDTRALREAAAVLRRFREVMTFPTTCRTLKGIWKRVYRPSKGSLKRIYKAFAGSI